MQHNNRGASASQAETCHPLGEWIDRPDGSRVRRSIEKGFDKAAHMGDRERAVSTDRLRREHAKDVDPRFPEAWGRPVGKHWIVFGEDGAEVVCPNPPEGRSLTVWRFDGFEATATFNVWHLEDGNPRWLEFFKRTPPGEGWTDAGPTDNYSTLWKRPLKGGAA